MRRLIRLFPLALLALAGCSITSKQMATALEQPKQIAIFFDGTNNDEESDTNVKRLHSLVSLQQRPDIATFYVEGVGSERGVLGMGTGWGFQDRVKPAYRFLLENYAPGDRIYIFGFSRGAYSARVLAALLHRAGLPANTKLSKERLAETVYDTQKKTLEDNIGPDRFDILHKAHANIDGATGAPASISVEVLGLWDTVEALGFPKWGARIRHRLGNKAFEIDVDIPNHRYGDSLCNVKRAYHALSLDDNREWIFTPLLLGREPMFAGCAKDGQHMLDAKGGIIPGHLKEVWFAGAHSDVGGGYHDSMLGGVSLNWMLGELRDTGLLPPGAAVNQDPFGRSHDPESGLYGLIYRNIHRNLGGYPVNKDLHRTEFAGRLCVHPAVLERRRALPLAAHENHSLSLRAAGPVCLVEDFGEGISKPQRLKERPPGSDAPCVETLEVEVFGECKGQQ
ncbi:DUF2235 domain-containing protein [Massilia sp. ST3]|uniref:phospholipase effector Tle1 domain-containing protein n=1 Tax=Massilia sp. ST3 TaxID=2824903 RepID=UPI001B829BA3|nr:DUF2235 domain-containing protein [Massilia sp. ST3]MBQ5949349.1 DUF2235 domain-containing protein [Massilia sp. ST3]